MTDKPDIPLLKDLLYRGHLDQRNEQATDTDDHSDLEISEDKDEQPGIINEEEIRMILVKHMDHAYAEIIQLLHRKTD